jgi:hypothetical protein
MVQLKRPAANDQSRDSSKPFRVGKKQAQEPVDAGSEVKAPKISATKVRLSADIDHQSYVKIKLYSATKRKSIVSLVTGWIDAYCTV